MRAIPVSPQRPALRRLNAALLGALAVACACATPPRPVTSAPAPPAAASRSVTQGFAILQINDTYKIEGLRAGAEGGFARVRALRRQIESEGRPVLVLHAGDFVFPSVMSKYLQGAPMIDALNLLDGSESFDENLLVTPGNHEFDSPDPAILFARIAQSKFDWLATNLRVAAVASASGASGSFEPFSSRFPNVKDHLVRDLGGVRVGLFSLTVDDQSRPWVDYGYDEPNRRATVARALDELERRGAEFVVALTHQEVHQDEWLAREFGERIDWIVGGHEHVALTRRVGDTTITKADADAKTAYRIDVRRGDSGRVDATATLVDLGAHSAVDPQMQGEIASSLVTLARTVEERTGRRLLDVVATTEQLLEGTEPAIRGRETALGNFLCDALRDRFAADLAFVNGGAIRVNDDVPAGGDLRVYELEGIFYYDDKPVVFEISGQELVELLRKSVSQATLGHGRFLQVAGLRFRYSVDPSGETRLEPADVEVRRRDDGGFEALDLARRYRTVSLTYVWRNGYRDGYPLFSSGSGGSSPTVVEEPQISWRALTEEAIAKLSGRRITTAIDGRIVRVEAALAPAP